MFLVDAYRAQRLEKKRTRLLNEAYARRAESDRERARAGRVYEREHRQPPREQLRPRTALTEGRHGAQNLREHNAFETRSPENLPSWVERANKPDENIRYGNVSRRVPTQHRVIKRQNSERAMPDIELPFLRRVDSLPKRKGPANYHPRHGHRYLRPDEHVRVDVIEYVQPLSCGRRAPGETSGYRGRLFHEGGPRSRFPPPRVEKPPRWAGPRPDGWI